MKQDSTLLHNNILNDLPVGVLSLNRAGKVIFANSKANSILKTETKDLLGESYSSLPFRCYNQDGHASADSEIPFLKVLETKVPISDVVALINSSSTEKIWVKLSLTPSLDDLENVSSVIISFEETLPQKESSNNNLNSEIDDLIQLIPDIILKVDHLNQFIYCHSNNPEDLMFPIDTFLGKNIGEVFSGDMLNLLEDKIKEVRNSKGIVVFDYESEVQAGKIFWFEARLMLSNNNVVMFIIRNITEQKLVEQQLHLEKQLSETTIKSLPGIFYLYNVEGKFKKWNQNFEKITGYSSQEILLLHPLDLFDDDEKELLTQKIGNVFESGEDSVEANFMAKDGSKTPFYFTGAALEYNGEMCLLGVGIDISEQKKAEEERIRSESRFKGLVENSSSGMAIFSSDFELKYISPALKRILGYSVKEFAEVNANTPLLHPDDNSLLFSSFEKVLKGDGPSTFVVRLKNKVGNWCWVETTLTNMLNNTAINGVVSNFRDVTEQVHAEEKLQKALQELQTHLLNTPLGVVEYNQDLVITRWSKKCEDIFGWSSDEVLGKNISGFDFIYDEDLKKAKKTSKSLLSSKVDGNISTNRNYTKDGRVIDCNWYNSVMKDDEGKVTSIMSLVEDITAAKKAELEVVRNEKRLSHLISNLPGIVYRCRNDENWTMHYISESCNDLLGFTSDELVNNKLVSFNSIIHEDDRVRVRQEAQQALKKNKRYELNYRIVTKSGEICWVWEKGGAVQSLSEDELILEGFIQDITKEHNAQTALEKSDKEKSFLLSEIHHRVKNNLAVVSGLMQLQALDSKEESTKEVLLDSVGRIKSIALIHEHLYTSEDFSSIRFDENIKKLVQNIEAVMGSGKGIITTYNLEPVELDINQAVPCALLINEIVTNTYKHAFNLRESGEIQISSTQKNGLVTLIIRDNGVGINKDKLENKETTSLGMKLIEVVTLQLAGKLTIDGSNGTTIKIEFNKQEIND